MLRRARGGVTLLLGLSTETWMAAAAAALLVGVAKAGFGAGAGVIATPLVALTLPVPAAAALLLPVLIGADVFAVGHYRRTVSGPDLRLLLPAAALGIVLGALAFGTLARHERILEVGVGLLALLFVAWQGVRARVLRALEDQPPSRAWGGALGMLAGFTSTLAHVGGPPVTVYLLPRGLPRDVFVGTTAWLFFLVNLMKLVPYALLGLLRVDNLLVALLLLPVAFAGTALGVWLNRRVDERLFRAILYVLLVLTGTQLVAGASVVQFLAGAWR